MYCTNCGKELEGPFCTECGKKSDSYEEDMINNSIDTDIVNANINDADNGNYQNTQFKEEDFLRTPQKQNKSPSLGLIIGIVAAVFVFIVVVAVVIILLVSRFSGSGAEKIDSSEIETIEDVDSDETQTDADEGDKKATEESNDSEVIGFEEVSNLDFYFSSGAGGWGTTLHINADGSFAGYYSDSDMGDVGPEYPNGIVHQCDFVGKFTAPEKIDDHSFKFKIQSLEFARNEGEEQIIDGVKYIYSYAYGLDGADELIIYRPGTLISSLSEELLQWIGYYNTNETVLSSYALYNVSPQYGFGSSTFIPEYTGGEFLLPNSATAYITEADLAGFTPQQLTYARNEIYARYGYVFKAEELNTYFAQFSWYIPDPSFNGTLSKLEQANAVFIEQYQDKYNLKYIPK